MSRISRATEFAFTTTGINLTNNAPANQIAISTLLNNTNELVSDRSIDTSVTTRILAISFTNPR
jgi:hypothetical protein